jgi:uncharacterized membrane protein
MIRHVPILGSLLIVHGAVLLLVGCLALFIDTFPFNYPNIDVVAVILSAVGFIQMAAGRSARRYQRYGFVTTGVGACMAGFCTVAGIPFSMILLIYGTFILSHAHVQWAFEERERGTSVQEILRKRVAHGDERDDFDEQYWEEPPNTQAIP